MKKQFTVLGLGTLLLAPLPAIAQSPPAASAEPLAEVVVTASRTAETVDEALAAVTVITREEIERGQYQSLADALAAVPGVQFNRRGGLGKTTGINLRGTATTHTLVLIDGLRVGSATMGEAALQHIPLSQIERIEVVRGPRSTLYGSDAVGGVIHIFTRKAGDEQQGSVAVGGGSHGTHEVRAALSGPYGDSHYSVGLSHLGSRGFDAQANDVPTPSGWGNTPNQPDRDGYREAAASLRLGHRFSPGNEVEVYGLYSAGTNEFDGTPEETDFRQQNLGLNLQLRPLAFWDITLRGGESRDEGKNFFNGVFFSHFNTKKEQLAWQNDLLIGASQLLTMGVDYLKDRINSSDSYDRDSRHTTGYYLQHRIDLGPHDLLTGVRHEDNQQFGTHNTYNVAYGLRLPRNLRLTASYGTAFRAPTFNDLYSPWGGNPALEPEKSKSYELALRQQYGSGYWRLGVFRTEIDNMIAWADTGGGIWLPSNINQARIDGLELESGHRLSRVWQLAATLTLLDPQDRESGNQLIRRSKRMATIDLDGDFGRWRAGTALRTYSSRYEDTANTVKLSGYTIVNLRAEYDLLDNLLLQGKIDNLFDKEYQEVATYNTPGRVAFATLTYSF
ncbi:TonB-dependent receptor domain-containing protein [Desulfurivibrio sp. D14AmB]|uniref:TonB-dependent receptor domain-containing protein n=1 Tax=Desulfurivibrio sp. D14AmB TaxID=3374370 RepID=UPI00376ECB55